MTSRLNSTNNTQWKRFSREGFSPLPSEHQHDHSHTMAHDATIDIPLEQVKTNASLNGGSGGFRNQHNTAAMHQTQSNELPTNTATGEKGGFFRGRRAKAGQGTGTGRMGYDGEEDTITTMGKVYAKIFGFSLITRYFLYILPLGMIIAVPIIVGAILDKGNGGPKIGGVPIVWLFSWVRPTTC